MPSSYTLGDRFEGFVKQLVASGRYASASEVLRDGNSVTCHQAGAASVVFPSQSGARLLPRPAGWKLFQ